jgi:GTP-binding protein HflX
MERAVMVIVEFDRRDRRDPEAWAITDELAELSELAKSAGCEVVTSVIAKPDRPVAATLIGKGKVEEIHQAVLDNKAQVVVFNQELSPAQQRNVEDVVSVKTIDRTQLILDIFAQRARSQEGKVQVELAQLRYLMPRLMGKGIMLSRLGGGIGTRGPGEQKLEVDRRRIRERITRIQRELQQLGRRRAATRQQRKDAQMPVIAMIGYTNAGKTTLLNRLTGAEGLAQNRPFTTLDPLARRLRLPSGRQAILTDTVGFLHKLPHHLIEAFKATLEEAHDADVLLHVLDASHPQAHEQAEAVAVVLRMLELSGKPTVTALNKVDQLPEGQVTPELRQLPMPVPISARAGTGLEVLMATLEARVAGSPPTSPQSTVAPS